MSSLRTPAGRHPYKHTQLKALCFGARSRALCRALLPLIVLLFASIMPAYGQGFMVNPMRIDVEGRPGQTLRVPLELRNTAGNRNQILEVNATHLGQTERGQWGVSNEDPGTSAGFSVSAMDWLDIPQDRVDIGPLEAEEVDLLINIPQNARGTYVAGLLVESPPPEGQSGISVRMRFIIPVIVEIQGRSVRQQVSISDVEMEFVESDDGASTYLTLGILNEGRTFPRVRGTVQVDKESDGRWRTVTRAEYREVGIVPGVQLALLQDLERRLPSGTYRLRADIQVDGRRVAPLVEEITFEGDADADLLAFDQTLTLSPDMLELNVSPGATRTSIITVTNPSDEPITVNATALTPDGLRNVAMGDITGEQLSAASWVEMRPSQFTLRPNGRQNLRVVSSVPRDDLNHANYYAILKLESSYADGQSAGETTSTAHLTNSQVGASPRGSLERVSLTELDAEEGSYAVSARFINIGNVHLEPRLRAQILNPRGRERVGVDLGSDGGFLLPLETREFGGELEAGGLDEGFYALRLTAEFAERENITRQYPVEVTRNAAGELTIEILEDEDDLPEDTELPGGPDVEEQ